MFERIRKRISSAHLIAFAALAVALSGTAYAATKIDTDDIKNKAVTKQKLDKAAVSTNRIVDGAVRAAKLGPITEVEETSPPAAVPAITATAECPSGTTVISGGFRVDPAVPLDTPIIERDRREDNGWQADAEAQNPGDTVTAYAYCLES